MPRREPATDGDDREHGGDEQQLADLDADVEEQQRHRDRQPAAAPRRQRAGEAEAVQQAEGEGDDPGMALRQPRPALAARARSPRRRTRSTARSTASTGGTGTRTQPSVAANSVMLCASVNAVMVATSRRVPAPGSAAPARTAGDRRRSGCARCRAPCRSARPRTRRGSRVTTNRGSTGSTRPSCAVPSLRSTRTSTSIAARGRPAKPIALPAQPAVARIAPALDQRCPPRNCCARA